MSTLAAFGGQPFSSNAIFPGPTIEDEEIKAVIEVLRSRKLSSLAGEKTAQFEHEFAKYLGAKYAVATSNGTTALHVTLASVGVNPGDEVIVPTITFISPVNTVRYCGAEPVFMDCDPGTLCLDVQKAPSPHLKV